MTSHYILASPLRGPWRPCIGRSARRRGARRRWRASRPVPRATPSTPPSGCQPRAACRRRRLPRPQWQTRTRCARCAAVGSRCVFTARAALTRSCTLRLRLAASFQAAQHWHLGAHRQRQDDADGAHPVLYRPHPRDPRGAARTAPPAAAAASPACASLPFATRRLEWRHAVNAVASRMRGAWARAVGCVALHGRTLRRATLRLRAATPRHAARCAARTALARRWTRWT